MMKMFSDERGLDNILFSDEPHFHLEGYVTREPLTYQMYYKKVTVWCTMSSSSIIGSYFFEDARGSSVTVIQRFNAKLHRFLTLDLHNLVMTQIRPGFNRMVRRHIRQKHQWTHCVNCFQKLLFRDWGYPFSANITRPL